MTGPAPGPGGYPDQRAAHVGQLIRAVTAALRALGLSARQPGYAELAQYPPGHPVQREARALAYLGILDSHVSHLAQQTCALLVHAPPPPGTEPPPAAHGCEAAHTVSPDEAARCFLSGAVAATASAVCASDPDAGAHPDPAAVFAARMEHHTRAAELAVRELAYSGRNGDELGRAVAEALDAAAHMMDLLAGQAAGRPAPGADIAAACTGLERAGVTFERWAGARLGLHDGPLQVPDDIRSLTDGAPPDP